MNEWQLGCDQPLSRTIFVDLKILFMIRWRNGVSLLLRFNHSYIVGRVTWVWGELVIVSINPQRAIDGFVRVYPLLVVYLYLVRSSIGLCLFTTNGWIFGSEVGGVICAVEVVDLVGSLIWHFDFADDLLVGFLYVNFLVIPVLLQLQTLH